MELVSRPSVWDNAEDQRRLGEYIRDWFGNYHINAELDDLGNVAANPGAKVILNGHIDVVPPAGEANFHPTIKDGKIFGRGTSDMKSGVAILMVIMRELQKKYSQLGAVFQVTEESEYEKSGVDILCERGVFDNAKFILEAEPSGELTTGRPSVFVGAEGGIDWSTEIKTDDSSYHAAYMHRANNAILAATRYINDLINDRNLTVTPEAFKHSYNPNGMRVGKGPINVAKITGGTQATWTPNRCKIEFEKRLYPSETWTAFDQELKGYSDRIAEIVDGSIGINVLWHADPFGLDPNSNSYRIIADWAKDKQLELSICNGASDLNKIYNYLRTRGHNVSGIHFGPGFLELAHTSDEYVPIAHLKQFYNYYQEFLTELFDGRGKSLL